MPRSREEVRTPRPDLSPRPGRRHRAPRSPAGATCRRKQVSGRAALTVQSRQHRRRAPSRLPSLGTRLRVGHSVQRARESTGAEVQGGGQVAPATLRARRARSRSGISARSTPLARTGITSSVRPVGPHAGPVRARRPRRSGETTLTSGHSCTATWRAYLRAAGPRARQSRHDQSRMRESRVHVPVSIRWRSARVRRNPVISSPEHALMSVTQPGLASARLPGKCRGYLRPPTAAV